jgi:hypothetical protein
MAAVQTRAAAHPPLRIRAMCDALQLSATTY